MKKAVVITAVYALIWVLCGCNEHTNKTGGGADVKLALGRFPGIDEKQMAQLLWARDQICLDSNIDKATVRVIEEKTGGRCRIPLPTWIPAGFKVEKVFIKVGKRVGLDSLKLSIVYNKAKANNRKQVFMIEAGFEFGDLPYVDHHTVKSSVGDIWLYYEPINDTICGDADSWGKPILKISETEWFGEEKLRYPLYAYVSSALRLADDGIIDTAVFEMISLEETKRILASIEEL